MTVQPTDQELVIRLKRGDLTALEVLDTRYRVRIIRLIAQLAKSYEEAEDIYQEAIFKATSHIGSFDDNRSFYNWLHRIAKNRCIDEYRRKGQVEMVNGDEVLLKVAGNDRNPLDKVADRELQQHIQKAIDALPKRQRSVASLRLLEGLDYKEIARRIGGSVQAVKSLFSVARKTLKTQLRFYLGCLAFLRPGKKGLETSASATMGISSSISLAVHLVVSLVLFYGATNPLLEKSDATSVTFITSPADSRATLRTIKPHPSRQATVKGHVYPTEPAQNSGRNRKIGAFSLHQSPTTLNHQSSAFPLDETDLAFPESMALAESLISSELTSVPKLDKRSHQRIARSVAHSQVNLVSGVADLPDGDFRDLPRIAPDAPPPTQANLLAISNALRRLRAFRRTQNMEAYSLAQLRRIARRLGQYPLLISRCRQKHLRALLSKGWMPIVILRSPVGGKHLWAMVDWNADAAQITLTNPLEQRHLQFSEADFMQGWQTSNAPATCLLLSTQPFLKPFQIDSPSQDSPRVWY